MEVADNLHQLATDLWEKQQQSSENSSQPPSKDNPYGLLSTTEESSHASESKSATVTTEQEQREESVVKEKKKKSPRKPGKQPGAKGFGRSQPLKAEVIVPHYADLCSACNQELTEESAQRYMGYYVLELEPELFGVEDSHIFTSLLSNNL